MCEVIYKELEVGKKYFEPSLNIKNNDDFESFKFGVFLDGLVYDQVTGEIFYYYYDEDRFDLIEKILNENFEDNSKLS